tara:strand:+ start:207 stop:551 length:345 start_codon:yes stop_codon:yes gene_type:complete
MKVGLASLLKTCHSAGCEKTKAQPTRSKFTILRQLRNLIPAHLVPKLARECGVQEKSRSYTPWSHVVDMLYSQLTHAIGLNDVCDCLRLNSGPLSALRAATPPNPNKPISRDIE